MHSLCTHMTLIRLQDRKIIVRKADKGEKFVTLDGQERELDDTDAYDM